jgi:hypothetical protein
MYYSTGLLQQKNNYWRNGICFMSSALNEYPFSRSYWFEGMHTFGMRDKDGNNKEGVTEREKNIQRPAN